MDIQCEICKQIFSKELKKTVDHVVPQWFVRRMHLFGFKISVKNNTRLVCTFCNLEKGGMVDYTHPTTKEFLKEFIKEIEKRI